MENPMRCLFGTDGVRDIANRGAMTPEMALRLGRAYVLFLTQRGATRPQIVVGRDTRHSGPMLESALVAGMVSAGAEVVTLGVLPTPAVSRAVGDFNAQGGVVISASHNPPEYNGIKFLNADGEKLRDLDEAIIEDFLSDDLLDEWRPSGASIGKIYNESEYDLSYARTLLEALDGADLSGLTVVFDCANGAAVKTVSELVAQLPCKSVVIGSRPDGLNINEKCGVTHLETLKNTVVASGADIGIAVDGDADRVLFVDAAGREINGDVILWVLAKWMKRREWLSGGVVATVMSNVALKSRLEEEDIPLFHCAVGDRYVLEMMKNTDSRLGGEQSGHVIVQPFSRTGDGLCTGLLFLRACCELELSIHLLVDRFKALPQKLVNLTVQDRDKVLADVDLKAQVEQTNVELGSRGRVFIRGSGTEPLIRLLVEAEDAEEADQLVQRFTQIIQNI